MKFDALLAFLMPKNDAFYTFFEHTVDNLAETSQILKQLPETPEAGRAGLVKAIEDLEHRGDSITHNIMSELNGTLEPLAATPPGKGVTTPGTF